MALRPTHELHQRRFGRNAGVGLVLVAFCAIVFALTIVKIQRGDDMQGYDHVARPSVPHATTEQSAEQAAEQPAADQPAAAPAAAGGAQ